MKRLYIWTCRSSIDAYLDSVGVWLTRVDLDWRAWRRLVANLTYLPELKPDTVNSLWMRKEEEEGEEQEDDSRMR